MTISYGPKIILESCPFDDDDGDDDDDDAASDNDDIWHHMTTMTTIVCMHGNGQPWPAFRQATAGHVCLFVDLGWCWALGSSLQAPSVMSVPKDLEACTLCWADVSPSVMSVQKGCCEFSKQEDTKNEKEPKETENEKRHWNSLAFLQTKGRTNNPPFVKLSWSICQNPRSSAE